MEHTFHHGSIGKHEKFKGYLRGSGYHSITVLSHDNTSVASTDRKLSSLTYSLMFKAKIVTSLNSVHNPCWCLNYTDLRY